MFRSMYLSNFHQFPTFTRFFNINTGNAIKIFDAGVVDDTGVA